MKFLIIDDNPAHRAVIVQRLRCEFLDAEFVEVGRPVDLEQAIEADIFDGVLTTYQLNWINGLQVFHKMRERFSHIPVMIFMDIGSLVDSTDPQRVDESKDNAISVTPIHDDTALHTVQDETKTILVVEDDPDVRFLMEEALTDFGYHVRSACDGLEGLRQFQLYGSSIALVISDLMMPRMRGKELYDHIQAISNETRFLFVSAYQSNLISEKFVLDKDLQFLQKPFDLEELASKVQKILS